MAKKAKSTAPVGPPTKAEIQTQIAESTGLSKKQVGSVFTALKTVVAKNLGKPGPKVFTLPGLVKFKVIHKKAHKTRKRKKVAVTAAPARYVVEAKPLLKIESAELEAGEVSAACTATPAVKNLKKSSDAAKRVEREQSTAIRITFHPGVTHDQQRDFIASLAQFIKAQGGELRLSNADVQE